MVQQSFKVKSPTKPSQNMSNFSFWRSVYFSLHSRLSTLRADIKVHLKTYFRKSTLQKKKKSEKKGVYLKLS